MKISKLTNGLLVSLLLTASVAEADSKYPATDFQPKVVYQDTSYKHSDSSATSSSTASASKAEVSVADPNYPAANFQPEVLYQDKNYTHSKGNENKTITTEFVKNTVANVEKAAVEEQLKQDDSSFSLIVGLAVLAVAGYFFYTKNSPKTAPARRTVARRAPVADAGDDSVSGVAKYLQNKAGEKPSGVAKYIEDRESTPVSGVAKYVAKKKVSARMASVTGVEKYLKERG